jgi:hypothetical protein
MVSLVKCRLVLRVTDSQSREELLLLATKSSFKFFSNDKDVWGLVVCLFFESSSSHDRVIISRLLPAVWKVTSRVNDVENLHAILERERDIRLMRKLDVMLVARCGARWD